MIGTSLVFMFGFSFSLLIVERYFSFSELEDLVFGLSGAYILDSFESYSELMSECDPSHSLKDYCENLNELKEAGRSLQVFLIFDILVLLLFVLVTIGMRVFLRKYVNQVLEHKGIRESYTSAAKWILASRFIVFLHPIMVLSGVLVWGHKGEITDLEGSIQLEIGLLMYFLHGIISLIFSAYYAYYLSSSKRRNIIFMLNSQGRKDKAANSKQKSDIQLIAEDLDF